jgi:hypothetical protein
VSGTGGNGSLGLTDTWLHYDHIGNVVNTSNASGVLAATSHQDAWGNVLASTTTGAWASSFEGRHLNGMYFDSDASVYIIWPRDYNPETALFLQPGSPYRAGNQNPERTKVSSMSSFPPGFGDRPGKDNCIKHSNCMWMPWPSPPTCHDCADAFRDIGERLGINGKVCAGYCNGVKKHSWYELPGGNAFHCTKTHGAGENGICVCATAVSAIEDWVKDNCDGKYEKKCEE